MLGRIECAFDNLCARKGKGMYGLQLELHASKGIPDEIGHERPSTAMTLSSGMVFFVFVPVRVRVSQCGHSRCIPFPGEYPPPQAGSATMLISSQGELHCIPKVQMDGRARINDSGCRGEITILGRRVTDTLNRTPSLAACKFPTRDGISVFQYIGYQQISAFFQISDIGIGKNPKVTKKDK